MKQEYSQRRITAKPSEKTIPNVIAELNAFILASARQSAFRIHQHSRVPCSESAPQDCPGTRYASALPLWPTNGRKEDMTTDESGMTVRVGGNSYWIPHPGSGKGHPAP